MHLCQRLVAKKHACKASSLFIKQKEWGVLNGEFITTVNVLEGYTMEHQMLYILYMKMMLRVYDSRFSV